MVSIILVSLQSKVFFEGGDFGEEPEGATVGWKAAEQERQDRRQEEGGAERQRRMREASWLERPLGEERRFSFRREMPNLPDGCWSARTSGNVSA